MSHSRIRIIGAGNVRIVRHVRLGMVLATIEPNDGGGFVVRYASGGNAAITATIELAESYAELRWGMPYILEFLRFGSGAIINDATGDTIGSVKRRLDRLCYVISDANGALLAEKETIAEVEDSIEQHWNGTDRYERSARIRAYERGEITGATQ